MNTFPPVDLQFGDCLLYNSKWSLVDFLIRVKSWSPCSHVEVYIGNNQSVASRNGIGVNIYALRQTGLVAVLRPKGKIDRDKAMGWFYNTACGQHYDWLGLFAFFFAKWKADPKKQFCSEFETNWYRAGGFQPFSPDYSSDAVAPGTNLTSAEFEHVWKDF